MTETKALAAELSGRLLRYFGLPPAPRPDLATLRRLLAAYTRTVPWESASRIMRRARHEKAADCALFDAAFWQSHFASGTGGTCYESNYAFFAWLRRLGYAGYLTLNNMGAAVGCHSAIIILLDGQKYMVDVGLPIHAVLPICAERAQVADSDFFQYSSEPLGDGRYQIWRDPHPQRNAFTLIDQPIADSAYRQALIRDYAPASGLFLDKLVINKVIDDSLWRFNSQALPLHIERFVNGQRVDTALSKDAAGQLAARFGIAPAVVAAALEILGV